MSEPPFFEQPAEFFHYRIGNTHEPQDDYVLMALAAARYAIAGGKTDCYLLVGGKYLVVVERLGVQRQAACLLVFVEHLLMGHQPLGKNSFAVLRQFIV